MVAVTFNEGQLEELLHIPEPWYIGHVSISPESKQLDVNVKFRKDALFICSDCGAYVIGNLSRTNNANTRCHC